MTITLHRSNTGRFYLAQGSSLLAKLPEAGAAERRGLHAAGMGERFAHDLAAHLRTHGEVIVTIR